MAYLQAQAQRQIETPPAVVYAWISDYQGRHRQALPDHFQDYTIEQGGTGAGTVVRWTLHIGRHRRPYRMEVSEPELGRVLEERDSNSTFTTRWEVTLAGTGSQVTMTSSWQQRSRGFPALFERLFAPRSLARLHRQTLDRLATGGSDQHTQQSTIGP